MKPGAHFHFMSKSKRTKPAVDMSTAQSELRAIVELNDVLEKYFPQADQAESIGKCLEMLLHLHGFTDEAEPNPVLLEIGERLMKMAESFSRPSIYRPSFVGAEPNFGAPSSSTPPPTVG